MDVGRVGVEALGAAEDGSRRRIVGSTLRHGRPAAFVVLLRTLPLIRVLADDWNFFLPPAQNHAELAGSLRQ